jgi:hypothetical protein
MKSKEFCKYRSYVFIHDHPVNTQNIGLTGTAFYLISITLVDLCSFVKKSKNVPRENAKFSSPYT